MMTQCARPEAVANPLIVLREEFDDWAILFDPDSGEAFGINPVGVFIWKHLDGNGTPEDIAAKLAAECPDMPEDALQYVERFIDQLLEKGLAGRAIKNERD
jgi:SynChlorMet cassette protein ScmD